MVTVLGNLGSCTQERDLGKAEGAENEPCTEVCWEKKNESNIKIVLLPIKLEPILYYPH